ncbi:MAG: nucleotidyltransferase family protein [Chloroflexota bacterium]
MDAIVTAGGIPLPEDPLYADTKGGAKALVDVAGKPMIQWVLDALSEAKAIDNVIVVGLTDKSSATCNKPLYFIPNQGKMLDNFRAGVLKSRELDKKSKHVLFVSSDIPAIKGEMIDWAVNTAMESDDDIYYNVIPRETMEERFPESKRTYTHLKDMDVCGGDMNVARIKMVIGNNPLWERISDARKSPLKQASLIGFDTLFLLLLRKLTLEMAAEKVTRRLNITGRVIVCPYAEIGMDVDKPHQLDLLRKDLKRGGKKVAKKAKAVNKTAKKGAVKSKKVKKVAGE